MSVINTNVMSLNSQRSLMNTQSTMATSLQRLSSGLRINSAKDDAAGLAIAERFTAQIRGLQQANRNANDGISMLQTAEGALDEVGNMLQRMRELTVQSVERYGQRRTTRTRCTNEYKELKAEIARVFDSTEFNGVNLLGDRQIDQHAGRLQGRCRLSDRGVHGGYWRQRPLGRRPRIDCRRPVDRLRRPGWPR